MNKRKLRKLNTKLKKGKLMQQRRNNLDEYGENRKTLAIELGKVGLPINLNEQERKIQLEEGIMPVRYNCHHILPKHCGGKDNIENLSYILKTDHEVLTGMLNHIAQIKRDTHLQRKDSFESLKRLAIRYGAIVLPEFKLTRPYLGVTAISETKQKRQAVLGI